MDSRLIYTATNSLSPEYEDWIHFGTEDKIKMDLITEIIKKAFLEEKEILFVFQRTNSEIINVELVIEKITPLLGKENFHLWDKQMKLAIEFHRIGVLRKSLSTNI